MRRRTSLRISRIYGLILLIIWLCIVGYANLSEERKMKNEFIDVGKEVYEEGERVKIELKNDGSAKWSPLSQYLKIYHKDSGEKVYDGHRDVAMPAVPKTQTVFWNQTDMEGKNVEPGEYRAVFLERYEAEFKIK